MDKAIGRPTSECRVEREADGYRFVYHCEICGDSYATEIISADSSQEAILKGEQEARRHFNRCCCAPRRCQCCGADIPKEDQYCQRCGAPQFESSEERKEKNG